MKSIKTIIPICLVAWLLLNTTFAYTTLTEKNHNYIDKTINSNQNISKTQKKEKAELYSNVANDANILINAYLWTFNWDQLKWKILTKESIETAVEKFNKLDNKKKTAIIESLKQTQKLAEELQRTYQIEGEENFQWYATTLLPTPLYRLNKKNVDINFIMWGEWTTGILFDSANTIDQLGVVIPKWSPVTLIDKVQTWSYTYYEVRTREFDWWYGEDEAFYLDARFIEKKDKKPNEVINPLPDISTIYKNLLSAVDSHYIWWGSYYQGIPEINEFYPTPETVKLTEDEQEYKLLKWVDCSWLLWQATNGYTPRNTSWLLTFWESVNITWNTINQIINKVKPLDLIVRKWHVIIILSNEYAIESIWKENFEWGVEIVKLKERLEDIFTRRQPVNEWNESTLPNKEKFVIRRRYK